MTTVTPRGSGGWIRAHFQMTTLAALLLAAGPSHAESLVAQDFTGAKARDAPASGAGDAEGAPDSTKPVVASGDADPVRDTALEDGGGRPRARREGPVPFEMALGFEGFSRSFTYVQDVNANLRPYSLALAPAARLSLEWYPGAHVTRGAAAAIGVTGDFSRSVATSSAVEQGHSGYTTTLQAFSAGLRGRIALGAHELGFSASAGRQSFSIAAGADAAATVANGAPVSRGYVPNVEYTYVRPGLDVRLAFGDVGLGVSGGYRVVLDAGEIQGASWFPRATVQAGDVGVFASYALLGGFHARIGAELYRYAYDMHSSPADLRTRDVAGGAVDQYATVYAALVWRAPPP